jgi:AcrR family transcriptional regulator
MARTKTLKSAAGGSGANVKGSRGGEFAAAKKVLKDAVKRGDLTAIEARKVVDKLEGSRKTNLVETGGRSDDILAAAAGIFASKGYHAATLQEIADELSLTRPAFYHYFKSKQKILEAICVATADAADAVVRRECANPGPSFEATLRRTLLAYTAHIANSSTTTIMWRNFGEMSPEKQRSLTARRRAREQKVLDLVQSGIQQGEFNTPEPKIATLVAFESINSLHNWFDKAGRLTVDQVADVLVEQVLHGILRSR